MRDAEESLTKKAEDKAVSLLKDRVSIAERETADRAYAHETRNLRDAMHKAFREVQRRVPLEDYRSLKEKVDISSEEFMSEKMRQMHLHKEMEKRWAALTKEVDNKPHYSELPVTANLLKDTKHFKNMCGGQTATEMKWNDDKKKVFGGEWEAFLGLKPKEPDWSFGPS